MMSRFCFADSPALPDWRSDILSAKCPLGDDGTTKRCPLFKPGERYLDYGELHKNAGYTAVILAGLAAVTSGSRDVHYAAAYGSALAAAGAVTTGYIAYGDRFRAEDGLSSKDNRHILLGTLGAIGCVAAIALADSSGGGGHAAAGVAGGAAMSLSIITIRW